VINYDYGYVHKIRNFKFIEGIFKLVSCATKNKYKIIIVTNQAGIGKGYYTEDTFIELNDWMCDEFSKNGSPISRVYYCPNHPGGMGKYQRSDFRRKPNPGMLLEAKSEFNLELSSCIFVGDQKTDMEAGISAGIGRNILFDASGVKFSNHGLNYKIISHLEDVIPML